MSALKMYPVEGLAHLGRSQVLRFDGGCHGRQRRCGAEENVPQGKLRRRQQ